MIGSQKHQARMLLALEVIDSHAGQTYTIVHIDTDELVTIGCNQGSQIISTTTLTIAPAVNPNPYRQSRLVGSIASGNVILRGSIHLDLSALDIPSDRVSIR